MLLIPSWKRFKSWSMPNRFAYVVGITTIIGVLIKIGTLFFDRKQLNGGSVDNSKTEITDNRKYYNVVNNSENPVRTQTVKKNSVFRINPSMSANIENRIKNEINFQKGSKDISIEIRYADNFKIISEEKNIYKYLGGPLSIYINDQFCQNVDDIIMPQSREGYKFDLTLFLNQEVKKSIDKNENNLSKRIIQCIN